MKAKHAKRLYEAAQKTWVKTRENFVATGAWWDAPSVVARLKVRMEAMAMRLGKLQVDWETKEKNVVVARANELLLIEREKRVEVLMRLQHEMERHLDTMKRCDALEEIAKMWEKQAEMWRKAYVKRYEAEAERLRKKAHKHRWRALWEEGFC